MLIGPLFTFELIHLARRGLQPRLRGMLVALLLLGLFIVYLSNFPSVDPFDLLMGDPGSRPRNRMARFGEEFMVMFLTVQLIAVTLLAPVYCAGGIIEEKDRKTLEFLQASQLTSREIILGKFFARIAFVLAIILAGLPVLMLTTFFGGVDPERLLAGFAIAVISAIHLGSFATMMAVKHRTLGGALFRTYLMLVLVTVIAGCCSSCLGLYGAGFSAPIAFYFSVAMTEANATGRAVSPWEVFGIFAGVHLLLSALFLRSSMRGLREPVTPPLRSWLVHEGALAMPMVLRALEGEDVLGSQKLRGAQPITPIRNFDRPRDPAMRLSDSDNPLVWKELHFAASFDRSKGLQTLLGVLMIIAFYPVALYLFVGFVKDIDEGVWIDQTVNLAVRIILEIVLIGAPVVVGLRTAACIGTERQKETMLTLLTLPWSRADILHAKWWGAIRWVSSPLRVAGISLAVGTLLLGVHPLGAIAAAVLFCGFLSFCASVGLMFSVYRGSVMRATIAFVIVWLLAIFGPLFHDTYSSRIYSIPFGLWDCLYEWGLRQNPHRVHYAKFMDRFYEAKQAATGLCLGLVYFALSWLCWRAAVKRFEKEGMGQ